MMKTQFALFFLFSFFGFSYAQLTLQDSLIAYYPMDGNALDLSGNGNDGSVNGAALTADRLGNPNSAYQFDGIDDFISLLSNQKFEAQFPITIAAWIQLGDNSLNMVFRNDLQENSYHGFWLNTSGAIVSAGFGDGGLVGPASRRSKRGTTVIPLNTWTHVAVVIRSASDMNIYINGEDDCGSYTGSGGNLAYSNQGGSLGSSDENSAAGPFNYFNGKMDEVRFYNRSLTGDEIRLLADTSNLSVINICQGESTDLDATSPDAVSYQWSPTTGLSCQSCPIPQATPNLSAEYRVLRTNGSGCVDTAFFQINVQVCIPNPCDPSFGLQDSLIAHYPLNGNALDASVNGNNGTVIGATPTTDRMGNPNGAYFFDGIDDYISLNPNQKFKPIFPVTITAWIELQSNNFNMVFRNDFQENSYHGLWLNTSGGIVSTGYGDGGVVSPTNRRSKRGTTILPLSNWVHVAAIIRDQNDMDIFVNGVNDCGDYSGTGSFLAYSMNNGNLGRSDDDALPGPLNWFHGKMDEIRFYNRELCIYEIRGLAEYSNFSLANICAGDSLSLSADNGSATYSWTPTANLSCTTCPNPLAFPTDTTTYQVIRDNGFSCFDTLSFQINVENCQVPCDTTILEAGFAYSTNGLILTGIDTSSSNAGIDRYAWDFGDGNRRVIFNPDTIEHQYFLPGSYDVCLIIEKFYDEQNVCMDTFCQTVMVDSIASSYGQDLNQWGWELYPNPAIERMNLVKLDHKGEIQLRIYNIQGEEIHVQTDFFSEKLEIDIQHLSSGLYILQVEDRRQKGFLKFIKE